jgi:FMN phosphatase YigB (HAD superfamily)
VVFDVGETLVNESRLWLRWAARLDVTPLTMLGLVGACAAHDRPVTDVFDVILPGADLESLEADWAADEPDCPRNGFDAADLYPDVRPAFAALRAAGLHVFIAGNQPPTALAALRAMDLGVDGIANSAELGVEKPDPRFFDAVVALVGGAVAGGVSPGEIAYVGDRLDNDVLPALSAGMLPVLIRRGPWGYLHAARPQAQQVAVIDSLMELPGLLSAR